MNIIKGFIGTNVLYLMLISTSFALTLDLLDGGTKTPGGAPGEFPADSMVSAMIIQSFPNTRLEKGSFEFNWAANYLELEADNESAYQESSGYGVSASLTYSFNSKYGVNFIAGSAKGLGGDITRHEIYPYTYSDYNGERVDDYGTVGALNVIWDPLGKSKKYSLPIILGVSYLNLYGEYELDFVFEDYYSLEDPSFEHRIGHDGRETVSIESNGFGFFMAFGFALENEKTRIMPFIFNLQPFTENEFTWTYEDVTTGEKVTSTGEENNQGASGVGATFIYKPLNLSFTILPPFQFDRVKTTAYSLSIFWLW